MVLLQHTTSHLKGLTVSSLIKRESWCGDAGKVAGTLKTEQYLHILQNILMLSVEDLLHFLHFNDPKHSDRAMKVPSLLPSVLRPSPLSSELNPIKNLQEILNLISISHRSHPVKLRFGKNLRKLGEKL